MDTKLFFDPFWSMPYVEIKQEKTKTKSKKKGKSKAKVELPSNSSLLTEVQG